MKIALYTETYPPFINGVATHASLLAEGLRRLGHEVLVVTADPAVPKHVVKNGVLRCPAAVSKKIYGYGLPNPYSRDRFRIVRDFDPDVIHVHTEFATGLSGLSAARRLHKPLVYTMHTMYDDYVYYIAPKPFIGVGTKILRAYIWRFARFASALTGPSFKVQEYMAELGVPTPVHVIHNCAELDAFKPENITAEAKHAFREKYGIADDAFVCVFVGRLGREKSADVLLDYWAKSIRPEDNCRLVIAGDGPAHAELVEQAKRLGLLDGPAPVIFTGRVEHADMPPVLAACDLYVTASLSDTNSISMLEGMATGLPTLQRRDPLIAEQITEGVNGWIFDSAEDLGREVRNVQAMSPEERAALSASVMETARGRGCTRLAGDLLEVYGSVEGDYCRKHWKYPSGKLIPAKPLSRK